MLPRILFRCDASPEIGSGHVMRCLTLAACLQRDFGGRAVFCAASLTGTLAARIADAGHALVELPVDAGSTEDAEATLAAATDNRVGALVVDGYRFPDAYRVALRDAGLPILSMDDTGGQLVGADIVVNASPFAEPATYVGCPAGTEKLLGPSFALVRDEVLAARHDATPADEILITFGGTDPIGITLPVTEALRARLPEVPLHVVVGGGARDGAALVARLAGFDRVRASHDLPSLGPAIAQARMTVSAASTTLYEIAALARPMVLAIVADNQEGIAGCAWAEVVDARSPGDAETVADAAVKLWRDPARADLLAARAGLAVDGLGAHRVVEALLRRSGGVQ